MRRMAVLTLLLTAVSAGWIYTSTTYTIWNGVCDLSVRVMSDSGPPRSVTCQAFGRRDEAAYALEHLLPPETGLWSATAEPFTDDPLTVRVPLSGQDSMSGRELQRFQFRYMVVVAEYPNGRRVGKLVHLPDCRESREISITLP